MIATKPTTGGQIALTSPKRLARIAGILYLLVGIFGGFAQGFVYPKIYVASDAATTAGNVLANSGLVRMGVVADLVQATVWVFVAMTLFAPDGLIGLGAAFRARLGLRFCQLHLKHTQLNLRVCWRFPGLPIHRVCESRIPAERG